MGKLLLTTETNIVNLYTNLRHLLLLLFFIKSFFRNHDAYMLSALLKFDMERFTTLKVELRLNCKSF